MTYHTNSEATFLHSTLYAVKSALLTDCYTRRAEMDGKTQAASRHIGDPQGAQGKVNRVGGPAGRTLHNWHLRELRTLAAPARRVSNCQMLWIGRP